MSIVRQWSNGTFDLFVVFQAEDGIRDLVRSRGLGDVYKRQNQKSNRSPLMTSVFASRRMSRRNASRRRSASGSALSLIHI